ncbi:MAG: type III secretory pathway component EscU [Reinekea sp.]|jgi:hypothetical protein|uniref:hypothetical protein n=1 Tax=Reinekea sp. TaxID=1970455 RepID=UPI0039897446
MKDDQIIKLLKVVMAVGILLLLTGIYLHMYEPRIEAMGVTGILISSGCVAFGMILSLPTKMFITFLLVKREADMAKQKNKRLQ